MEMPVLASVRRVAALAHGNAGRACFNLPPVLRPVLGFLLACILGLVRRRLALKPENIETRMENTTSNKQRTFLSTDGLVRITTTTRPRRWPPHSFPVVIVTLKPRKGTRILPLPEAGVEWMPRYSEVLSLLLQMGLTVTTAPSDKPEARRLRFEKLNAWRHRRNRR
jgi:hypothetical protein